jgi:UDP-glucose 4-epimerase/UDP-glucuronate decarboxylase
VAASPGVRLLDADLTRPDAYPALGTGYDEVYHLAAIIGVQNVLERPHEVVRVNAMATLLLLDWFAAGGAGRFLFASTSEAYAWTQAFHPLPIPTPEDVPLALTDLANPRSSYAGSKIFGELAVTQYARMHRLPAAIVRFHNVYGPRMGFEHVIPQLYLRAMAAEGPLTVYSPGHQRAFCHVSDAVAGTIQALRQAGPDCGTFNLGNDQAETSIGDLARMILALAGKPPEIVAAPAANDPILRRCPDLERSRKVLGYAPRVGLAEGLADTLAWYRTHA